MRSIFFGTTWAAGERTKRLPFFVRPFAILARNVYIAFRNQRAEMADDRRDTYKQLTLGVRGVYDAGVDGDIAEFGTMAGATAEVIAKEMERFQTKRLHLFDSFAGLPESTSPIDLSSPNVKDGNWAAGVCKVYGATKEAILRRCARHLSLERISVYNGWFADTLELIPADTRFSLVHIDCDLYLSAKQVLDYCFSRRLVSPGALIYFDDWNCNYASPEFGERRAWAEATAERGIVSVDLGDYGHAGHRFRVVSFD